MKKGLRAFALFASGRETRHCDLMTADDPRPLPVPDEQSREFWAAAARAQLVVQRCESCGWYAYPPVFVCRTCHSAEFYWNRVSGIGRVRSWTVVQDAFLPGFADEVPYVIGDIELVEQPGLRMITQLIGLTAGELKVGLPVTVRFQDLAEGLSVPQFGPQENP